MANKSQTKAIAKTSASSPAKSSGKAKPAKARAAPLSIALAKKTSPVRLASRTLRTVDRRTRAKAKPLSAMKRANSLREQSYAEPSAERPLKTVLHKTTEDIQPRTATQEAMAKPFEKVPETIEALRARITAPDAARQGAETMLHAGSMTFHPLLTMVRQQAIGFNLMLDMLQIQRRFVDMWRPRHL